MRSILRNHRLLRPAGLAKGTPVGSLINQIISVTQQCSSYLEIGIERGFTLESVKSRCKIGVDPQPLFCTASARFTRTTVYRMTSDEFFVGQFIAEASVDVAFIDGLHTAAQAGLDFIRLSKYLHRNSVVLIDDTVPSDFHSSLATVEEAYQSRRDSSPNSVITNHDWHGDVYKLVLWLSKHTDRYSIYTIVDIPNPLTVVVLRGLEVWPEIDIESISLPQQNYRDTFCQGIPVIFNPTTTNQLLDMLRNYNFGNQKFN